MDYSKTIFWYLWFFQYFDLIKLVSDPLHDLLLRWARFPAGGCNSARQWNYYHHYCCPSTKLSELTFNETMITILQWNFQRALTTTLLVICTCHTVTVFNLARLSWPLWTGVFLPFSTTYHSYHSELSFMKTITPQKFIVIVIISDMVACLCPRRR